jgi:outer membrane protein assembly factor BamB
MLQANRILQATGVQGGLVVHVGCGDGQVTVALRAGDGYLVHGLDRKAENVEAARRQALAQGLGGKVTADLLTDVGLPLADNLVNLLVVEDRNDITDDEVMRVLAPLGVAYVNTDGTWLKKVKPWPDAIDQWTHYLHDASGNAVAHDSVVGAPRRLQWVDGPLWSRSHEYDASLCAMVSARGRVFSILDEGPTGIVDPRIPDQWMLIARDAFSGVILWKKAIPDWGWTAWKRAEMEQLDWARMSSQRMRLPAAVPRRLVAAGDRVYATLGYRAPLTALNAATGETLSTYADTERTDEIVHENGRLVLCIRTNMEGSKTPPDKRGQSQRLAAPATLVAIEADSGRRLWRTEPGTVVPLSLGQSDQHVFYHDGEAVVCLEADSGALQWRTPASSVGTSIWNSGTTLVVHEDVVLCGSGRQLLALSAADGKVLWTLPAARGYGVGNPPDVFVADGLVWYGQGGAEPESMTGFDPVSGKPARTVNLGPVITHGHHARCYRSKATDNFLLLPKRAVEFVDIQGNAHSRHNWVRGACRYGVLPCNGLLYSTPHPCFCYAGVKLGGFLALSSQPVKLSTGNEANRLVRGPAWGEPAPPGPEETVAGSEDWTMYRHDPRRSGSTRATVAPAVEPVWTTSLGGKLTQPVITDGRVLVARVDAGQLCCLDTATGEPIWDFAAGGRIDSSPTIYPAQQTSRSPTHEDGLAIRPTCLCLFGSADGWVYCLRMSDGALVWRYRAAPDERRVVAFGQVESAWPVHGSVLLLDGVVYCTAGRSSFLDGGLTLFGLDALSGEKLYEARIDGPYPDTGVRDEMAYSMEGAKSDILVTDGELIYLFHNAFSRQLVKQPTPVEGEHDVRNLGVRSFGEHLFSNAGFLDDSGFNRSYWMVADRWPAFNFAHQSPKAGQIVVFDGSDTFAAKCFVRRNMLSPQAFPATDGYLLFADSNDTRAVEVRSDGKDGPEFLRWLPQDGPLQTCWNLGVGFARSEPPKWVTSVPVRIRAMLRTGNALYIAGPPDVCQADDPAGALQGRKGGVLLAFDAADGRKLSALPLDSPPVFDGLSAACGRLYLSNTAGEVICLGEENTP